MVLAIPFSDICFGNVHSIKTMYVVYFDQHTAVPQSICLLKSALSVFSLHFSSNLRKKEVKIEKAEKHTFSNDCSLYAIYEIIATHKMTTQQNKYKTRQVTNGDHNKT